MKYLMKTWNCNSNLRVKVFLSMIENPNTVKDWYMLLHLLINLFTKQSALSLKQHYKKNQGTNENEENFLTYRKGLIFSVDNDIL